MLEILNLDKKETLSIDAVSSQEFSEVIEYHILISFLVLYFHVCSTLKNNQRKSTIFIFFLDNTETSFFEYMQCCM